MPVLLQVLSMWCGTKAEERRLLRVLQLWLCAMSTGTDRNRGLRALAGGLKKGSDEAPLAPALQRSEVS
jgi:hypothetical protein